MDFAIGLDTLAMTIRLSLALVLLTTSAFTLFPAELVATDQVRAGFAVDNGDNNGDLTRDFSDALGLLHHLFLGGAAPVPLASCAGEAAEVRNGDVDDNGQLDVLDAVGLIRWLTLGHREPASACSEAGLPRIAPLGSDPYGQSYGDWAGGFWQWALSIPASNHPLLDTGRELAKLPSLPLSPTEDATREKATGTDSPVAEDSDSGVHFESFEGISASDTNRDEDDALTVVNRAPGSKKPSKSTQDIKGRDGGRWQPRSADPLLVRQVL